MISKKFAVSFSIVLSILLASIMVFIILGGNKEINKSSQEVMICYSSHDIYEVHAYDIADDNETLITSHGRIYHIEDCRKKGE